MRKSSNNPTLDSELFSVKIKIAKANSVKHPFLSTKHFLSLAVSDDPKKDPILKQVIPSESERIYNRKFVEDPLNEKQFSPLPKLIHRYKDRALILCTNKCFIHCRFCFRKRIWKNNCPTWKISETEFEKIEKYVSNDIRIRELILSGGDPLTMPDEKIFRMLSKIDRIPHVNVIRIATRALSAEPSRVNARFVRALKHSSKKIWFMSHFNHPAELSKATKEAIRGLSDSGIPVLNQTVLLKGINDNPEILSELFRNLVSLKAIPHYLFHV
ncbi:MAG TPA: KamA family radical SAM protein, partial [Victivallales bacterium]|nr:KamA family radical SAM protein [Victivallales bacterium]